LDCLVAIQFLGYCRKRSLEKVIPTIQKQNSRTQSPSFAFSAFFTRCSRKVSFNELHLVCSRYQFVYFSRAVILLTRINDHQPNETSQKFYVSTAVFYVSAQVSSNSALRFISYPSQVIAKGLIKYCFHFYVPATLFLLQRSNRFRRCSSDV
jgi:uncharacterized membrane protein